MASEQSIETPKALRAVFIPFYATSHLISLADIACLFASRGVDSTILVTPVNAAIIQRTVDNIASSSGHPIRTVVYPFPSAEASLTPGVENLAATPLEDAYKMIAATPHARPALESLVQSLQPDCIVASIHFGWTAPVSRELGVPLLIFGAMGAFPVCALSGLSESQQHLSAADDTTTFLIPGLPHPLRMTRPEMPDFILRKTEEVKDFMQGIKEMEAGAMGVIFNSFSEIESAYSDHYYKMTGVRSWFVGPVSLAANASEEDQAVRGAGEDSNSRLIMAWLDTKPPGSVVYICFGSWCHFSDEQIKEMADGLESCGHPFLWIVREGFEPPTNKPLEKGMVVKGWAPQVAILSHQAVGAFVTHCGWNSLLEGVTAGLPMLTWPLSTEQFINEKLIVDVLKIGVKNWEGFRTTLEENKVTVKAEDFAAALARIMDAGEETEGMRRRAREYAEMARAAVKPGGSSYNGLTSLIDEIRAYKGK